MGGSYGGGRVRWVGARVVVPWWCEINIPCCPLLQTAPSVGDCCQGMVCADQLVHMHCRTIHNNTHTHIIIIIRLTY